MRYFEVVHLIWKDSSASIGWDGLKDLDKKLENTHTVGLLLHQDGDMYVIASSYDPSTDTSNARMVIPRAAVVEVRALCTIKTHDTD